LYVNPESLSKRLDTPVATKEPIDMRAA
jgi:hypothetical protein